jgi:hypothetical protein
LGKSTAASSREPQIISLSVSQVQGISNISLEVISSQNADLQQGFLQYYTSLDLITDFSTIKKRDWSKNSPISVKNSGPIGSEYVYIWIDPQKIITVGDGFVRLRWKFDSVAASSSSSSSSSCTVGRFYEVNPYEEASLLVSPCEVKYFQLNILPEEFTTVFLNGDPIVIENNGGMLVVNSTIFLDSEYQSVITAGTNQYAIYLMETDPFFVRMYKVGNCSIYNHILLNNNDDLLTIDGFRMLLLNGTQAPGDALILSNGEEIFFVDGFRFLLIGRGTDYSSSSSYATANLEAYAVYGAVNGSFDQGNTFIVPRMWFENTQSPYAWTFTNGWAWDQNCEYGRYLVDTGQECNSESDCSNVIYSFDWNLLPAPPDCSL